MSRQNTPALPIAQYRAQYSVVKSSNELAYYLGSAVRGAFGHALKKAVCVTRLEHCEPCLMFRTCAYAYIFETPTPDDAEKMRLYKSAPHPYVFDLPFPGDEQPAAGNLEIGFTLFGRGNQYLPYVLHALEEAGKQGIGRNRIELALETVEQRVRWVESDWKVVYQSGGKLKSEPPSIAQTPPPADRFRIVFETPLRLRSEEHNIKPDNLRFADLFVALMRRISMLTYFHTDTPLETDFKRLASEARKVEFSAQEMRWHDWTRYSSRQKTTMRMGGLLGSVELDGTEIRPFWPYLWLGQWTHAGKGTSMGLGRYRLVPASLQTRTGSGA